MIIQGDTHTDHRGKIRFVNDFSFKEIKRFYVITHPEIDVIRAWQGHRIETKYFFAAKGSFLVNWIKIDDWRAPSKELEIRVKMLSDQHSEVLVVPRGHANGFRALEPHSELIVFSDKCLKDSLEDDFRYPADYWTFQQESSK